MIFEVDPFAIEDPVREVLEHVNQLALWSETDSIPQTIEHAFDELETFEIPITLDVVTEVMRTFFGSPNHAREDHQALDQHEIDILYPGMTAALLSWYMKLEPQSQ